MPKPPIIIGGCPRSGTTLLRTMLDSHPNIYSGVELGITMQAAEATINTWERIGERASASYGLEDGDIARAYGKSIEHILETIRQKKGKPRIADKMPQSVQHFSTLCWMLPDSPLIHLIRDGRDAAVSIVNHEVEFNDKNGNPMQFAKDYVDAARYWNWITRRGMLLRDHPKSGNYYEIFYEDLVKNPEIEMRKLLKFLNEPWDKRVLEHYKEKHDLENTHDEVMSKPYIKSIGRWRKYINERQEQAINNVAGELLTFFGYK